MITKEKLVVNIISILFFVTLCASNFFWQAPTFFPEKSIFSIEKGSGLNHLAIDLNKHGIIRSPFWFKTFSVLFGGTKGIIAGDYVLDNKETIISIAYRFSKGDYRLNPVKITIPEGLNVFEISTLVSDKFYNIDKDDFIKQAGKDEGYLFPDTYLFLPNVNAKEVIKVFKENFSKKIELLNSQIEIFKSPLIDIVKMASIIEEEAKTTESRKIISGILWRRISLRMPLQVDSSFKYINGKTTANLTLNDLKIDSPYNSYVHKGLPPTPISNPGLDSIIAAINPTKTDYLYFLTDSTGNMHYAKTFEEHLQNKELYLK